MNNKYSIMETFQRRIWKYNRIYKGIFDYTYSPLLMIPPVRITCLASLHLFKGKYLISLCICYYLISSHCFRGQQTVWYGIWNPEENIYIFNAKLMVILQNSTTLMNLLYLWCSDWFTMNLLTKNGWPLQSTYMISFTLFT